MRETHSSSKFNEFRRQEPAFQTVLVLEDNDQWNIYEDVAQAVDALLAGKADSGRTIDTTYVDSETECEQCADTGSTTSSSLEVMRRGVEKIPARLMAFTFHAGFNKMMDNETGLAMADAIRSNTTLQAFTFHAGNSNMMDNETGLAMADAVRRNAFCRSCLAQKLIRRLRQPPLVGPEGVL